MPNTMGGPLWFLRDNTPEIVELLHKQVGKAVRDAAFAIQAKAMAGAPFDTHFLQNSIYTVTSTGRRGGDVQPVKAGQYLLDEVPALENDQTAYIAVGANYGIYQEYGTANMAAHPYLQPAFDAVVPTFLEAMKRVEDAFPLFKTGALGTTFPGTEE